MNYAVFVAILENLQELYEDTADFTFYRWNGTGTRVASAKSLVDPSITILFTLGCLATNTVFVAPTDGDPQKLGDALARVEAHFAERGWGPHYGHLATFEHPYLAERERVGLVTVSPMALAACKGLPERVVTKGKIYGVVAVIWLDAAEYEMASADGLEYLERKWSDEDRDFVHI
jgi:hypothetical protein